jgi:hypothetical protein
LPAHSQATQKDNLFQDVLSWTTYSRIYSPNETTFFRTGQITILLLWLIEPDVLQIPQLHKHSNVSGQLRPTPQMKHKGLIITTIAFFLAVNTTYFWEGKLGLFAMPAFLILVLFYLGLAIALLRQLYFAFKEKFADKLRLVTLGLITTVLCLTFIFPFGIITFDRLSGGVQSNCS